MSQFILVGTCIVMKKSQASKIGCMFAFLMLSSPEPLAHGQLLLSMDVCRPSSVVNRQQLLHRNSPPKLLV